MIANCAFSERKKLVWLRGGNPALSSRTTPEEKGIALTYGGSTYAVMMATPAHLQDFGIGFTITEGIVELAEQIASIEVIENDLGMEIRMWLNASRAASLVARRRAMVGSVGCGLCGIESLEQACSAPAIVASRSKFHARDLLNAMGALAPLQRLNQQPHAMHAAAFWERSHGIRLVREDVGRHNALDKLAGALWRGNVPGSNVAVLLTSRVSVETVQKAAMIGVPAIIAVSAPTTLAIDTTDQAGITLIAVAREDGYEVFTHPDRLIFYDSGTVAA
jgi:FdhD protein